MFVAENASGTICCRTYAVDYIVLVALVVALCISETSVPYTRYVYHSNDLVRPFALLLFIVS